MKVSTRVLWEHPDNELVKELVAKYGPAPNKV
jgi:hypothetical protein